MNLSARCFTWNIRIAVDFIRIQWFRGVPRGTCVELSRYSSMATLRPYMFHVKQLPTTSLPSYLKSFPVKQSVSLIFVPRGTRGARNRGAFDYFAGRISQTRASFVVTPTKQLYSDPITKIVAMTAVSPPAPPIPILAASEPLPDPARRSTALRS